MPTTPPASTADECAGARQPPPVLLIGRAGCHLCADAEPVVRAVAAEFGVSVADVSVDDDAGLRAAYGDLIPVVIIDGLIHAHWRVDPDRLRAALAARAVSARDRAGDPAHLAPTRADNHARGGISRVVRNFVKVFTSA